MPRENAEYKALERVVTADKRYRKFVYVLTLLLFAIVIAGGYQVEQSILHKIDVVVGAASIRSNAREKDIRVISEETTRYTTCLFILPIDQRTPANQERCFAAADLPGGLTRSDFSPVILKSEGIAVGASGAPGQSASGGNVASSSNSTPASQPKQSNTSQPTQSPAVTQPIGPETQSSSGLQRLIVRLFRIF